MTFNVGVNVSQGLFTKTQFRRGDIPTPGTRGTVADAAGGGITKEFISVKFTATATRLNGELVTFDPTGVATRGTVAEGGLALAKHVGILTYNASVIATLTMTGTHYGWAQIWGKGKALVGATVTASIDAILEPGADGVVVQGAIGSTSANLYGLTAAIATTVNAALVDVFIDYPRYQNITG